MRRDNEGQIIYRFGFIERTYARPLASTEVEARSGLVTHRTESDAEESPDEDDEDFEDNSFSDDSAYLTEVHTS